MTPIHEKVVKPNQALNQSAYPPGISSIPLTYQQPCGGSSTGSGVEVSAGFVPLSLGTEIGGSLVYPAGKAGLYAIRLTLGTVSANGVFRITRSFDGTGGMAKTSSDLAALTENILAPEARGNLQSGGFESVITGKWDGLRISIAEPAWGTGSTEKWNSPVVVCF